MPELSIDALDVIRFLALETGNYMHLNAEERAKTDALVTQGKQRLQTTKLFRETEELKKRVNDILHLLSTLTPATMNPHAADDHHCL